METLLTVGAIIACILLFSLAIFIHEFGHFIVARRLGLRVEAFSIGFGPALWKKTIRGVEWRISAIPFGGYVSLPDLDPEGTKALEGGVEKALPAVELPAWKRIAVAFAGPFGNIVLAVVLAIVLAVVPGARFGELPAEIGEVPEEGPAHEAGLRAGDRVVAIDGHTVSSWTDMQTEVQISGGRTVSFTVLREGAQKTLTVTPQCETNTGIYYIMALSTTNHVKTAAWMPARNPLKQLAWDAGQIVRVLKALVTPREAKSAAKALGGPVMIAEGLYHQVRHNIWDTLGFLRFLDINLAILNLLPIPVLDGGLILFALYELIRRKKAPKKLTDLLSTVFLFLFLALFAFLVVRDVARSRKLHRLSDEHAEAAAQQAREARDRKNFKPAFNVQLNAAATSAVPAAVTSPKSAR